MEISRPELEVIRFGSDDVIATSLFYIAADQYSGSYSGTGNYVQFNGTMRPNGDGTYVIDGVHGAEAGVDGSKESLENVVNGYIVFPEYGVSIPAVELEGLARQVYNAYSYGDGTYYTHGASYYETHWQ